jgi:hypothetical protein
VETGVDHGFPTSQNVSLWRRLSRRKGVRRKAKPRHFRVLRAGTRTVSNCGNRRRVEIYATIIIKRPPSTTDSRATPPHRQNLLERCTLGKWTVVQTRDCTDQSIICQVAGNATRFLANAFLRSSALREEGAEQARPPRLNESAAGACFKDYFARACRNGKPEQPVWLRGAES